MFLQRSAMTAARRVAPRVIARRTFASSFVRREEKKADTPEPTEKKYKKLDEIKTYDDLLPPGGAKPGTVPTDYEQATGLERLEILGKMEGIDVFDMRPLDSSRVGTLEDPIVINTFGKEQYVGCTGCPADSHNVLWLTLTREEPVTRCMECGSAYKMHYIGPPDDPDHPEHVVWGPGGPYERPKNMADFIKPEYENV